MSISCEFDEFTSNNKYNQIIKATLLLLIKKSDVQNERKLDLKRALIYFSGMDDIDTSLIAWNNLIYTKNNQTYQIIINICYFIIQAQLLSDEYGQSKMMNFIDEFMHRLYEKFILEYYKEHYKYLNPHAAEIKWLLDEYDDAEFLPSMISDIYLTDGKKILIIDAKYYSHTMQENMGSIHITVRTGFKYLLMSCMLILKINIMLKECSFMRKLMNQLYQIKSLLIKDMNLSLQL